jgi:hypothetical protein
MRAQKNKLHNDSTRSLRPIVRDLYLDKTYKGRGEKQKVSLDALSLVGIVLILFKDHESTS